MTAVLPCRRAWLALFSMVPAVAVIGLDVTILSVALPTLAQKLDASSSTLQWFMIAYTLTFAAAMIPSGTLGDRWGRKRTFLGSLAIFTIGSLACALSNTSAELIASRALLGVGAAGVSTLCLALITAMFESHLRGKAMTVVMLANMIGMPVGPMLGGWMLAHFPWGWIFVINVPICLIGFVCVTLVVPESRAARKPQWDVPGLATLSGALVGLCYGITQTSSAGFRSTTAWLPITAGAVLLVAFLVIESRATSPLVPLTLFRRPQFVQGAVIASMLSLLVAGLLFMIPQYTQAVLGASTERSGAYLLPFAAGMVIATPLANVLVRLVGRMTTVLIGLALIVGASAWATTTTVTSGGWLLVGWATVYAVGFGMGLPIAMDLALGSLDIEASGVGSAVLQALRQVATTIGAAVLGSVLTAGYRSALPTHLPAAVDAVVRKGVEQGMAVAHQLGSTELAHQVQVAFVNGANRVTALSAVTTAVTLIGLLTSTIVRHRRNARREVAVEILPEVLPVEA